MARILVVTWDGGGNVPPALGIAAELVARGHRVRVLGHPQQRAAVQTAGFDFAGYTHAKPFSPTAAISGARRAATYFGLFNDPRPGDDVRDELAREPTDLVLADALSLGALRAAQRAGVATAVLVHTFHRYLTHSWARGPIGLVAALRGLRPHYPAQQQVLTTVLAPLDGTGTRALVATGVVDPAGLRAPAGVELHRHLDRDEVLPRASLLVGHGGHATTLRALSHDLPVLVVPLDRRLDQKPIGDAVAAAGAGRTLPPTAPVERVREAVLALLADGPHRASAAAIGARIRATDGAARAADELEAVLSTAASDVA